MIYKNIRIIDYHCTGFLEHILHFQEGNRTEID